ncbi:hypothetical protein LZG04_38140 [Saccharothrix sp. S26]|uniref:hypothetical protein n=1 Tax=Saccharothrix sp. S26 TaxID=2907215 RepID=UPI001F4535F7|nr:hypothetical protein [Saccharothrix sp. S26]MCE7000595.1 hypothetical protein [Saccharothrix sp. S26]
MSGVAVVFGLCALSFAAGCVLTAVMLRRDSPPEPTPEPAPAPPPPRFELRFPPEDYATKPIHRNPVMGVPTALPAPRPARPKLVLVPDPKPAAELPVRQDAVRRMHVVRPTPTLVTPPVADDEPPGEGAERADTATSGAYPGGEAPGTVAPDDTTEPANERVVPGNTAEPTTDPAMPGSTAEPTADPVMSGGTAEPTAEPVVPSGTAKPVAEPADPMAIQVAAQQAPPKPGAVPTPRTFEAARRESNR